MRNYAGDTCGTQIAESTSVTASRRDCVSATTAAGPWHDRGTRVGGGGAALAVSSVTRRSVRSMVLSLHWRSVVPPNAGAV
jgi:hypothetical protein